MFVCVMPQVGMIGCELVYSACLMSVAGRV